MGYDNSYLAVCPFFLEDQSLSIRCAGCCGFRNILLSSPCKEHVKSWRREHCHSLTGYKECFVFQALELEINLAQEKDDKKPAE